MKKNKVPNFADLGIDLSEKLTSLMPDWCEGKENGDFRSIPVGKLAVNLLPDNISGGFRRGDLLMVAAGHAGVGVNGYKTDVRGHFIRKMMSNATVGMDHQYLSDNKLKISLESIENSFLRSQFPIQHPLPTDHKRIVETRWHQGRVVLKPTANETSSRKVMNSTLSGRSCASPEFNQARHYFARNSPFPLFNSQEVPFVARLANFILDHCRQSKVPYRKTWLGFLLGDLKYGQKPSPTFPPANKFEQLEEALEYYASYMTWYQSHMVDARRVTAAEVLALPEGLWWQQRQSAKHHL